MLARVWLSTPPTCGLKRGAARSQLGTTGVLRGRRSLPRGRGASSILDRADIGVDDEVTYRFEVLSERWLGLVLGSGLG